MAIWWIETSSSARATRLTSSASIAVRTLSSTNVTSSSSGTVRCSVPVVRYVRLRVQLCHGPLGRTYLTSEAGDKEERKFLFKVHQTNRRADCSLAICEHEIRKQTREGIIYIYVEIIILMESVYFLSL